MNVKTCLRLSAVIVILTGVAFVAAPPASATILDLTTAGASGFIGSAYFHQVNNEPTGTGVIDPFLRIQASPTEQGVNSPGPYTMDEKTGIWTHAIRVSDFGVVTNPANGTPSIRVLLDINETAAANLLSWDQLRIYTAPVNTYNTLALLNANANLVYQMGAGNVVHLNYLLDNGSGSGDVMTYIPVSLFAGHTNDWLYWYTQFGAEGGVWTSDDGFEEFARVDSPTPPPPPPPVPEPTSLLLLGGGLLGLAGFSRLKRR